MAETNQNNEGKPAEPGPQKGGVLPNNQSVVCQNLPPYHAYLAKKIKDTNMKWSPRFEAVFKRNLDLEKIGEKKNSDMAILMDRAWDRTFGIQKKEDKK